MPEPANADRVLVRTLRALGAERGISVTTASGGWIVRLSRGRAVAHVVGYTFPLNLASAHLLAQDKAAAAEALGAAGVPCVPHRLVLRPDLADYVGARGNWAALLEHFHASGGDVVVKPNDGTGGLGVERARTVRELEAAVHAGFAEHRALSVSPFRPLAMEARAVVLDGEVLLAYEKHRLSVTGDGRRTLGALAAEASAAVPPGASGEIVPAGETRLVDWRHNLGRGARPAALAPEAREAVSALALRAADALGLRFASVDVVAPEAGAQDTGAPAASGGLLVMEANAGVMLEAYARAAPDGPEAARRVYGAALDAVFG